PQTPAATVSSATAAHREAPRGWAHAQPAAAGLGRARGHAPGDRRAATLSDEPRPVTLRVGGAGGRCRIRTCEGILRRIYSPLPLAARATCRARRPDTVADSAA